MRWAAIVPILVNFQMFATAQKRVVIAAGTLFDGRGHVLRNQRITLEDSKIVEIAPKAGPTDYDLRRFTVMPGWIDAHVHIRWSFGDDGKNANSEVTCPR